MANFIFIPNTGFKLFGNEQSINIGMSRIQIRSIIGDRFEVFVKTPFSKNSSDSYRDLHVRVDYNVEDFCQAIEIHRNSQVFFKEKNLIGLTYLAAKKWLALFDENLVEETDGLISNALGVSLYIPRSRPTGKTRKVETVLAFGKGYYDLLHEAKD